MIFRLENNVTKKKYEFAVEDIGNSTLYYHFNMSLTEKVDDGEYNYWLYDDEETNLLAQGICQIGDYVPPTGSTTVYTKENKDTYIQYNGNI